MTGKATRDYYDRLYAVEGNDAFPADYSRYRAWFGRMISYARPGAAVLDFGCGVGHVCSALADLGYQVSGVEISSAALKLAREREPRATFLEAQADGSLPFTDASFDVIACLGVLEHIPEPAPVVAELRRVARDGARAVWIVPNARSPFFWFGHGTGQVEEHPRSLDAWCELLTEGGWTIERVRRDPGPIDRPVAIWKRMTQAVLNRLPLELTYQFVIESRAA